MVDIIVYSEQDIIALLKKADSELDKRKILEDLLANFATTEKVDSHQEPYEISILYPTEHSKHYVQVALKRMGIK